jgi:peptide chain release factor subunit 1
MMPLGPDLLRHLAAWETGGALVTSLYLSVDGRRYPRTADYLVRLDEQMRRVRADAPALGAAAAASVAHDLEDISASVREGFERGDTRGLAIFASHAAGLWQEVRLPRPVRDRLVVASHPEVLPLQQLLDTYRSMAVALVDSHRARLFLLRLGRVVEVVDVHDEPPTRHERGRWARQRAQRHREDHRAHHLKRVADRLLALERRGRFDDLVLAGPAEAHLELEKLVHDYVGRRVRTSVCLPMTASVEDVTRAAVELEERIEAEDEAAKARALLEAAAGGRGVIGLPGTLEALGQSRVRELVVALDRHEPGTMCAACGWLAEREGRCPACGSSLGRIPDVVDAAVARAVRAGSRVDTVVDGGLLEPAGGVGALLRF